MDSIFMILAAIVLLTLIFAIARQLSEQHSVFFMLDPSGNIISQGDYD